MVVAFRYTLLCLLLVLASYIVYSYFQQRDGYSPQPYFASQAEMLARRRLSTAEAGDYSNIIQDAFMTASDPLPSKDWYAVTFTEKGPNNATKTIERKRMTLKPPDCGNANTTCKTQVDISKLADSAKISETMDKNTQASIMRLKNNNTSDFKDFQSSFLVITTVSPAAAAAMKAFNAAKQSKQDFGQAFTESQDALMKLKAAYAQTGKQEGVVDDPTMPPVTNELLNPAAVFYEPGSFKYDMRTYVPNYEDSVFFSKTTMLPEFSYTENTPDQLAGFCRQLSADPNALESKCNSLLPDVCSSTDCCVLLGGSKSKCVAGDEQGPIMTANYSDFTIQNRDFYYFQGKCYGNCNSGGASSMAQITPDQYPAVDADTQKRDAASAKREFDFLTNKYQVQARAPWVAPIKVTFQVDEKVMAYVNNARNLGSVDRTVWKPAKIVSVNGNDMYEVMFDVVPGEERIRNQTMTADNIKKIPAPPRAAPKTSVSPSVA